MKGFYQLIKERCLMSIYSYSLKDRQGNEVSLEKYKGKVLVIVNTATGCGFTPHYEPLEAMYEKYHDQGLEIIDVPCNQFFNQAPGNDEEIHEFCSLHYNTQFDQFKKADINGENEIPLYHYLKEKQGFKGFGKGPLADKMNVLLASIDPNYLNNPDIKWNFTKFVVSRTGDVVARFEPTDDMNKLEELVKTLL